MSVAFQTGHVSCFCKLNVSKSNTCHSQVTTFQAFLPESASLSSATDQYVLAGGGFFSSGTRIKWMWKEPLTLLDIHVRKNEITVVINYV